MFAKGLSQHVRKRLQKIRGKKRMNDKHKPNGGEFLGCRRINGVVYIYQEGIKFRVENTTMVIDDS